MSKLWRRYIKNVDQKETIEDHRMAIKAIKEGKTHVRLLNGKVIDLRKYSSLTGK